MKRLHPAKILVLGYLFYSILGCLLLSMPICHHGGEDLSVFDDYFTAISALSTSGLATVDLGAKYNLFGQIIIMLLIQLGGIGYMTFSSFVLLCTAGRLSAFRKRIGSSSFGFPQDFSIHEFLYSVIIFSFLSELFGAALLSFAFWQRGVENFIWQGIFHGVSAFCTAGLSTFTDGFVSFRDDFSVNFLISALSILGSLGFIVALDFYKRLSGQKNFLSFTTKVILVMTCIFLFVGILLFFILETLGVGLTHKQEMLVAFFQVATATTTTGFNTVDIGALSTPILILLGFLTTYGSAPSGTGGGLKNTAFATMVAFVRKTLKGQPTSIWHHEIPRKRVKIATVAFIYYIVILSFALFVLTISEKTASFLSIFFETVNALNNSGLSMGLTATLTNFGKAFISLMMLVGRVGILTFGVAISSQEDVRIAHKKAELIT